jgi:predicted ATPase
MKKIIVENLGPIRSAEIALGDLTIFVGPQATGKSVLLQLLKLLLDYRSIREEMRRFNLDWRGEWKTFLELYFGEGISDIYNEVETRVQWEGKLALREGLTRPFTDYRAGDPFVVGNSARRSTSWSKRNSERKLTNCFLSPPPGG